MQCSINTGVSTHHSLKRLKMTKNVALCPFPGHSFAMIVKNCVGHTIYIVYL